MTSFEAGQRIRLPGEHALHTIEIATATPGGWRLYVEDGAGTFRKVELTARDATLVEVVSEDGDADPAQVLAALWVQWMRAATLESKGTTLATAPLRPYAHQWDAVWGAMLPQPRLRFLLADEPGTGKTVMAGMYLREMERLGFIRRALVVCPAHLVEKWQADFDRFFGGGLRRITADTVREGALALDHDLWVTSLDLASVNPAVQEAIRPDRAGWDCVVIDEAHRLTLSAQANYQLGRLLSVAPRVLLMTATPHRGKEALFRGLLHIVDPDVFPAVEERDDLAGGLKPGSVHYLRRMKEELRDYDGVTRLFKARRATNLSVALNAGEEAFYRQALELVDRYFPPGSVTLAKMVYGKRAASSLYALRETLKRRRDLMGTDTPTHAAMVTDPEGEDEASRDQAKVVVEQSLSARAEREELKVVIAQLDDVLGRADMTASKWPRMVEDCLTTNGIEPANGAQAVVFTEFADTAEWLVGRFRDAGYTAERYSGRVPDPVREDVRRRFARREFQVIVSTDAGNEGIDLQTAHVLVNWDIPWSLVRLEQRMGRIHRVGQTRDVELYNLVATGTREGQVLEVLLSNFVVAANQLDGKMFDSLSLVAELVNLNFGEILARTYDSPERATAALEQARSATAARMAAAARAAADEENALRSAVDIQKAVAALQEETLERVNPRIVEAFLSRLADADLLSVGRHAAAAGLFVLSPGSAARGSLMGLPRRDSLVATSGAALERARAWGADVSHALPLGPSDPAFRGLVDAAAAELAAPLHEGARLVDQASVTDYALFAYETEITEFGDQRRSTWPFLVRVDETGARPIRWEWLANLAQGLRGPAALHPARATDADGCAAGIAEAERLRRAAVLDSWLSSAVAELERLPTALTSHIEDRLTRVDARARVDKAVASRLAALRRMAGVEIGRPVRVGWAAVSAAGATPASSESDSEDVAMRTVASRLRAEGWSVADVHLEGRGYDLLARRGREIRSVEVKGVWQSASASGVRMTGHELLIARQLGADYWLYVVDRCADGTGALFGAYRDPAETFADLMSDVAAVAVPGSALAAARSGEAPT